MKPIPKKVTILGLDVKITHKIPENLSDEDKEDVENSSGVYFPHRDLIWINKSYDLAYQWKTLYHEIVHVVMNRNGLRYSGTIDPKIEEIIAETCGMVFFELNQKLGKI